MSDPPKPVLSSSSSSTQALTTSSSKAGITSPPRSGGYSRCCLGIFLPLAIFGVIGFLVYYLTHHNEEESVQKNIKNIIKNLTELDLFHQEDPFVDLNGTHAWPNNGTGLKLKLVNALDDVWYKYFDKAVGMWDDGTPDALTLYTANSTSGPDTNCTPENGFIKVCNGDYGKTDWKGINKVLLNDNQQIYASAARMNDHFLPQKGGSYWEKLYTMCHEIGHGFGLPHTDEHFYNLNQGNCMDYTTRPKNNAKPDTRNFKVLAKLYGTVPNRTHTSTTNKNNTTTTSTSGKGNNSTTTIDNSKKNQTTTTTGDNSTTNGTDGTDNPGPDKSNGPGNNDPGNNGPNGKEPNPPSNDDAGTPISNDDAATTDDGLNNRPSDDDTNPSTSNDDTTSNDDGTSSTSSTNDTTSTTNTNGGKTSGTNKNKNNNRQRKLRSLSLWQQQQQQHQQQDDDGQYTIINRDIPSWIMEAADEIDEMFSAASSSFEYQSHPGYRKLRSSTTSSSSSPYTSSHHFDIGYGYSIQVHILHA